MGWEQIFSPVGENGDDQFGYSVAISGNYAIVGAYGFDGGDFKGKAYWYERQRDGKWVKIQTQPGESGGDTFGISVAISGNYAIVGAEAFNINKGKAYWYERQRDGKWVKIHEQPGDSGGDFFGSSVAISGNYAIVGARGFNNLGYGQGKAYWYERQKDGKWVKIHEQPGENGFEEFGLSVAISGNYAIVGARGFNNLGSSQGKAYWYERQRDGKWVKIHEQPGENGGDSFGVSVAISGNYAIVGAEGFESNKGKAYWYERQRDGKWVKIHEQPGETAGDSFGVSVAISGNYAIVGAYGFEAGTEKGKVYWYQKQNSGEWREVHTQPGESGGDRFGWSMGISGNYAIVGAYGFDGRANRGKGYFYLKKY